MITRASVGIPANTMALLTEWQKRPVEPSIWLVQLMDGRTRRYFEDDLEVIK